MSYVKAYQASADCFLTGSRPTVPLEDLTQRADRTPFLSSKERCGLRGVQRQSLMKASVLQSTKLQLQKGLPTAALLEVCLPCVLRSTRSSDRGWPPSIPQRARALRLKLPDLAAKLCAFRHAPGCSFLYFDCRKRSCDRGFERALFQPTPGQVSLCGNVFSHKHDTSLTNHFWFSCGVKKRQRVFHIDTWNRVLFACLNNNMPE